MLEHCGCADFEGSKFDLAWVRKYNIDSSSRRGGNGSQSAVHRRTAWTGNCGTTGERGVGGDADVSSRRARRATGVSGLRLLIDLALCGISSPTRCPEGA